jgi:predicted solute-binding protein
MTNNKQQTAVEWFSVRRDVLEIEVRLGKLSPIEYAEELTKAEQQAKEMEKQQRSIELPSDEEIEKESFDLYANHNTYSLNVRQYKAFKRGAKWMRDKIQGGEQ